jgi:membrane associated rhomboid family serine protease
MIPLRDPIPSRQAPVVTWALIFVNVLVFLFELTLTPRRCKSSSPCLGSSRSARFRDLGMVGATGGRAP